jgi:hypothetical protein
VVSPADAVAHATVVLAIVTGVLALVTLLLVRVTWTGIRGSQRDANRQIKAAGEAAGEEIAAMRETTAAQLEMARSQLAATHRPLLIEVFPSGPIYPDMGAHKEEPIGSVPGYGLTFTGRKRQLIDPRSVFVSVESGTAFISVPLRNVGRGLAVVDSGAIQIQGPALSSLKERPVARRVRVPVEETTRVDLIVECSAQPKIAPTDRWFITVPYTDFAGQQRAVASVQIGCPGGAGVGSSWFVTEVQQQAANLMAP